MNIFLFFHISTHFKLMMHQNSVDINGFSSKCLECHPGNRIYLGDAHVRSHRLFLSGHNYEHFYHTRMG